MTGRKKPDRKKVIPPDVDTDRGPGKKTARAGDSVVSKNPNAGVLRQRAEKRARKKPESMEPMSPAEARKLIYELSVHQIELEMQNDELRASEGRLEEAREQYFNLYEMAPVGYFSISGKGIISEANLTGANMLGVLPRDLRARQFSSLIFQADQHIYSYHRKQLFTTQEPQVFETRMVRADGALFWARVETILTQDGKSGEPACRATMSDITAQKQAGALLRGTEEQYRLLSEHVTDTVWLMDMDLKIIYQSPSVQKLRGFTAEEITEMPLHRHVTPESYILVSEVLSKELPRVQTDPDYNPVLTLELEYCCKDGSTVWTEDKFSVIRNEHGRPVSILGEARDITERKKAEEALRESEERWQFALEGAGDGLWDWDAQTNQVYFSHKWKAMLGYGDDEIGSTLDEWDKRIHPDDRERTYAELNPHLEGSAPAYVSEHRVLCKDGTYKWILDRGMVISRTPEGKPLRVIGTHSDISLRKEAEYAVRESEARLREVLDNSLDASYKRNLQTKVYDYLSPTFARISGYAPDEMNTLPLETVLNLIHPDDSAEVQRMIAESLSNTDNKAYRLEYRFKHKQGHYRWVQDSYTVIMDRRGQPLALIGSVSDITERKVAEQELRQREQDYSTLVENSPDMIIRFDTGLRHVFCNAAVEHQLGVPGDMFIGKTPLEIAGPDEQAQFVDKALRHTLETGVEQHVEQSYPSPTGERLFRTRIMPERDDKGRIKSLLAISSDITDRKRLEEEQQRVAKLESVGVLAGGIAHDFNNILTAILGNISIARMEAAPGSEIHESLEQAEKASLRAKALTKQLLTFSKGGAPVKKLGSLTEMLKDTAGFALRGSRVKCHFYIPDDLWHAEIDEGQVSQVIHNLIVNAQQAMPAGGNIELTAENMCLSESQSLGMSLPLKAGDYVRIAVADHGSGIPAKIIDKIFDPFFSTKPKGSGLGLATSFSIARQHGGHLSVESEPGSGTTFYLYLPASTQKTITEQDAQKATKTAGKARILVMDDEKGVREIAGRMLRHIGYEDVEFAKDGTEAIKLYKAAIESGNPFGAAILDLTVPGGMGGEVAVKHLLDIDPATKAIVSSGYIDDPVMARYGEYGFSGVVAKPYTIPELRKAVHDVIG